MPLFAILLLLALIWLVVSLVRKEYTGSGFWYTALIIAAVLLLVRHFGV
jgi:uncharacterized membrane protein